jgi:hypothetical protein
MVTQDFKEPKVVLREVRKNSQHVFSLWSAENGPLFQLHTYEGDSRDIPLLELKVQQLTKQTKIR